MTQEHKELLLKDLSARLPYGIRAFYYGVEDEIESITLDGYIKIGKYSLPIEHIKPYLFPLSSMTEEQYKSLRESGILSNCSHSYKYVNTHIHGVSFIFKEFKTYSLELIEWLNKNHFDYRGLIEKGLAIDATNLNIY